jgi:hypothetical protein
MMKASILISDPKILAVLLAAFEANPNETAGACFGHAFARLACVAAPLSAIDRAAVALCQGRQLAAASPC